MGTIVFAFSPVGNENKPLDDLEKKDLQKKSRYSWDNRNLDGYSVAMSQT